MEKLEYSLCVFLIPEEEGGYSALSANLPGCVSQGETQEEAYNNIVEAATALIESYLADGEPIPWAAMPGFFERLAVEKDSLFQNWCSAKWLQIPIN